MALVMPTSQKMVSAWSSTRDGSQCSRRPYMVTAVQKKI